MNIVLAVVMALSIGVSNEAAIEDRTTFTTFTGNNVYVHEEREWKLTGGYIENEYEFNTYEEYYAWRG